ncbi:MAG: HAD hydrolase-like protein, partial [Clostridia bacterium]
MSDTKFPKVIIADFDRTLAYLYKDEALLQELTVIMREYYSQFIEVPKTYFEDKHDGYFAWHALHKLAVEQLANGKTELAKNCDKQKTVLNEVDVSSCQKEMKVQTETAKNLKNSVEEINRKAEQIVTAFETEILSKVGLIDGAVDTIVKLRKLGIRLGIVSNNAESAIRHSLKLASVEEQF